jgi:hypothetical protein
MVMLPFLATAFLLHPAPARLLAAFLVVMALFLLREPLIVLARQRWVWRDAHAETGQARRFALGLSVLAILAALAAIPREAWPLALVCGAGAAVLMGVSIILAVRNRQHSVPFQVIGAVGLAGSSLAAALASGGVPGWAWLLWGASSLHGAAAIPLVHARLALRRRQSPDLGRAAIGVILTLAASAAAMPSWLGVALLVSSLAHLAEWASLLLPGAGQASLSRLGVRLMAGSVCFTILLAWSLALP